LEQLNWTDVHLEIMIDGNHIDSFQGYSWQIPAIINIDFPHTTDIDESSSDVETSLADETTSEVETSSEEHSEETTQAFSLSFYYQVPLITILIGITVLKRNSRR
jgi:hypothetical protein